MHPESSAVVVLDGATWAGELAGDEGVVSRQTMYISRGEKNGSRRETFDSPRSCEGFVLVEGNSPSGLMHFRVVASQDSGTQHCWVAEQSAPRVLGSVQLELGAESTGVEATAE